jgi:hypothetical protein
MAAGWRRLCMAVISVAFAAQAGAADYIADIEDATKNAYASGTVTLSGIRWDLTQALINGSDADWKNGARAIRAQGFSTTSISMLDDKTDGAGTVSFSYRRYGTDTQVEWGVEYSSDQGTTWQALGDTFTGGAAVNTFTAEADVSGNFRMRIICKAEGTPSNRRLNIDDIFIGSFEGVDETPPVLAAANPLTPANGQTGVSLTPTYTIRFSETVYSIPGGLIELRKSSDDSLVEAFDIEDFFSVMIENSTVTVTPFAALEHGTSYHLTIQPDTLEDEAGNPFEGFTSKDVWAFTTVPADTTGPVAVTLTPAADKAEATAGRPLTAEVRFNEAVDLATDGTLGTIKIFKGTETTALETLNPAKISIFGSSDRGVFEFDTVLNGGETYRIEVEGNVFVDAFGNPNLPFSWSFTGFDISNMKVAVNKFLNNDTTDVVELLVVADGPGTTQSLEGMVLKDYSGSGDSDNGGAYTFKDVAPWTGVRAGTLIVLTDRVIPATGDDTDLDDSDFVIRANLRDTTLFTVKSGFNIGATDIVQIKAKDSPIAGVSGAMHSLSTGSSGGFYVSAPPAKVSTPGSSSTVYVSHPTSGSEPFPPPSANDFNYGVGGAAVGALTFGMPNNARNGQFIDYLRGTNSVSVSIASTSRYVSELASVQTDAITINISQPAAGDTTVNLSASPAGAITLPASVVIPTGSTSALVSFTPVSDGVAVGNRDITISATVGGMDPGTAVLTLVEEHFQNPPVVINKYQNGAPDKIELLVIQDGADLSGMIIKDFSTEMSGDGGGKFLFTDAPLWKYLPSGTLVVLSNSTDAEEEDFDPSDFVVKVRLRNTTYFNSNAGLGLNIGLDLANVEMVMLKAAGSSPAGLSGSIHTLAGGRTFANPEVAGALYYQVAAPKTLAESGGAGVYIVNSNSTLADFHGTDAVGGTSLSGLFGLPNNETNEIYINALRAAAAPMAPKIVSSLTATGTIGTSFSYTISATGTPTSYNATGLPSGLGIDTLTGIISGTPAGPGTTNVTITATNGVGTGTETLVITIEGGATGFSSWLAAHDPSGSIAGDHDGDGVPNGVEYFFGLTGSGFTANPQLVNGKITWPDAGVADLVYAVQTSSTLAEGSWVDVPEGDLDLTVAGFISYTPPVSTPGAPKLFIRFLVETPPN